MLVIRLATSFDWRCEFFSVAREREGFGERVNPLRNGEVMLHGRRSPPQAKEHRGLFHDNKTMIDNGTLSSQSQFSVVVC